MFTVTEDNSPVLWSPVKTFITGYPKLLVVIMYRNSDLFYLKIFWEKKAAQEQFDRNNKNENWSGSSSSQITVIETDPVNAIKGSIVSKGRTCSVCT